MSEQISTYITAVKISSLVFFSSIIIIYCLAQYVGNLVAHSGEMPPEAVSQNLTLPGRVYPRQ